MGAGEDGEFTRRMTLRGYSLRLITSLTAIHLGVKHGGCGRRSLNPEVVDRAQLRVATYCCLKNRRYPRFVGWADAMWRCYRFFALNRAALCAHPAIILRRHVWFLSILPEMARMVRHNSVHENDASLGNDEIGTLVPKGSAN